MESEEDELNIKPGFSIFAPDLVILHEHNTLKYSVTHNRNLTPRSLVAMMDKGGRYIFNLGIVNFFEFLIVNMFLLVYSYQMETELIKEMQEAGKSDPSL